MGRYLSSDLLSMKLIQIHNVCGHLACRGGHWTATVTLVVFVTWFLN